MNQIEMMAFSDEMQKIAVRWKEVMRAGGVDAGDVSRLRGSGLLDYGKEISGLERGTQRMADQLGVHQQEFKPRSLVRQAWSAIRGDKGAKQDLIDQGSALFQGGLGGGYVANPGSNTVTFAPSVSPLLKGLKGQARQGADALAKRHEIDEIRAALKEQPTRRFIPGRTPTSLSDKFLSKQKDLNRWVSDKIYAHVPKENAEAGRALEELMSPQPVDPNKLMGGIHFSPSVLTRESTNVATLPPEVKKSLTPFRRGEQETLGPYGFQYGQSVTPQQRKSMISAFRRREI